MTFSKSVQNTLKMVFMIQKRQNKVSGHSVMSLGDNWGVSRVSISSQKQPNKCTSACKWHTLPPQSELAPASGATRYKEIKLSIVSVRAFLNIFPDSVHQNDCSVFPHTWWRVAQRHLNTPPPPHTQITKTATSRRRPCLVVWKTTALAGPAGHNKITNVFYNTKFSKKSGTRLGWSSLTYACVGHVKGTGGTLKESTFFLVA